jgi:hypothetical protein
VLFQRKPDLNTSKELGFEVEGNVNFGFMNIYSQDNFDPCLTMGDIYSWNISDWTYDSKVEAAYKQHYFYEEVCQGKTFMQIDILFEQAILFNKINGGQGMMNIRLNNYVPYTYVNGSYMNVYTNEEFNSSLWYTGQPNSEEEQCVACYEKFSGHCRDESCFIKFPSYYQISNSTKYMIR